jgi:four helix bundle protein
VTSDEWLEKAEWQGTGMSEQAKPRHYKELLIWQKGMRLAKLVYQVTQSFPAEERYGLTSQLRRAAVSVPSNIAEGQARRGTSEFLHFLSITEGSLAELETQLLLAVELEYCRQESVNPGLGEIDELQKMIVALKRKISVYVPAAARHSAVASRGLERH